jgi:diguanylate cyclase (GGDEF)-like protein
VIDIRTFMLVLAIGNIGFAMLMAGYSRSATVTPAMRIWAWGKLVLGCSHLLGFLRPDLPFMAVPLFANTFMIVGTALELAAYCIFFRFAGWKRALVPFTGLALLIFHSARFGGATGNQSMVLMSVIIALYTGAMAWLLLRPGNGNSLLRRLIGANDLIFFVAISLRGYTGMVNSQMTVFTPGTVTTMTFVAGFLLMIVNSFGFLLLCKEEDDRKMALLATTDSLTGLVNRRAFFERTDTARLLATRLRSPISLMMIDIDHFKKLNDRFGHATGDEALCLFADTVRLALRDHDIMGRLGGEEFALVLPGTDLEGAKHAAERLRTAVAAVVLPTSGNQYTMTVSIGVVVIDPHEHINSALARADHALYAAKSAGRDRVEVGEPRLRVVS